jgi:hypothetical protein
VLWGSGFGLQGLRFRDEGRALRIEDQDLEFRSHENAVFMHGSHICMQVNWALSPAAPPPLLAVLHCFPQPAAWFRDWELGFGFRV